MIQTVLKLRGKQFLRYLKELGIIRVVILSFLLITMMSQAVGLLQKKSLGFLFIGLLSLSIIALHLQRKDTDFLQLIRYKVSIIYQAEYLFLSFPLTVLLLLSQHFELAVLPLLIALAIAYFPKNNYASSGFTFAIPFISNVSFEWKAGLRKQVGYLMILYVSAIVVLFGFPLLFWLPPILILLLSLVFSSFYLLCESRLMLQIWTCSPQAFLRKKIGRFLWNYFLILTPLILIYLLFNSSYWYLLLYSLIAGILICILAILLKYSMYEPAINLEFNNTIIGLTLVSFLIPYLGVASLLLFVRYYRKSMTNLKVYL